MFISLLAARVAAFVKPWSLALAAVPLLVAPAAPPLYTPRQIKLAYDHGTRSLDGKPGAKYWQNHGRYTITVTAAPPDRMITGSEQIAYANESPDTLTRLVFKLFLNIHRPGAPRVGNAAEDYLTSGVHIDAFSVDGKATAWPNDPRYATWQPIALPAPLAPHDSVRLAIDWHYEISKQANREGMIDSTTYYLAYFYPRVAVYDDYNGWDTMDFTDEQEFYSDFNDYDVTVRVPANYIVWGTGTLRNAGALLQPEYLRRFQSSFTTDQTVRVATKAELATHGVTAQSSQNAWHFTASDIPDMAFGLSDHYDWDAGSVVVDDATHRRASVQAAYNDTAADFHHMVQMGRHALDFLSHQWPGVPYPYEKSTVFQGGAGMEYPMMVNDESYADTSFASFVAAHEMAHTYMPFYMGINETRYGFMDEGWATTFEYLFNRVDMGPAAADKFYEQFRINGWAHDPSPLEDLPIITPEDMLKNQAYGNNAYGKPSLGYLAVKELLGDSLFKKALHEYMDRWHGKHPTPWDFFYTFNDASGKDLDWFWNNWFFSDGYIDLAVRAVTRTRTGYTVQVDNLGGFDAPFDLRVRYTDGTGTTIRESPAFWQSNAAHGTITLATSRAVRSVALDGGIFVDADSTNNVWNAK